MSKVINIKSFNSSGVFVKNITDATFESFRKTINGGLSDLTIKLARKIDDFNSAGDASIGNRVDIWVFDEDTTTDGTMIYSGFIEQQNGHIQGGEEYVEIVCYGMIAKLNNDILKSGSQTKLYTKATDGLTVTEVDQEAAEVSDVVRAIIELFNDNNPNAYIKNNDTGVDTIEDTGNNMQYTFIAPTYFNALDVCLKISPQNWYWFLDSNNNISFKPSSNTADHTFLLSKHIANIRVSKVADSIKNILLLFDGDVTYKQYKDDTSIALYGRRVKQETDINIKDSATMDNYGASFIEENKEPKIRLEIDIIDNNESDKGYDIESINPGQTCKITGITPDGDIFSDNMIITEVVWYLDRATLIIETDKDFDFNRFILDIDKQVMDLSINRGSAMPESYT